MELVKNKIQFCDRIMDHTSIYEESTDAIVPDAFPDIARVVFASGNAMIKDESPQNDRLLISGNVKAVVLYQPEGEEGLREMQVPLSFAHIEEGKGITGESSCFVSCRVLAVDAKAVNSRKLSVTVKLCFESSAYAEKMVELTQDIISDTLPLEMKYQKQCIALPEAVSVRDFTLIEDMETTYAQGAKLLHTRCDVTMTDCRPMHSKAIVKGDMRLHCLLLENGMLRTAEHTAPFTQIIDCERMEESQKATVQFAVHSLDCQLHDTGILSVGVGVCALLCVVKEHEMRTIADLYQTTHALEVQTSPVGITGMQHRGELRAEINETCAVGMRVTRVIAGNAACHNVMQEDDMQLRVVASVHLLLQDEDAQVCSVHRTMTFPVSLAQSLTDGSVQNLTMQLMATPSGEENVALRVLIGGELYSRTKHIVEDITQVEAGAPCIDRRDAVTLVVRYVEQEEELWNIAKQYHTTTRAICGANDLALEQEAVQARMLLIPICEK